MSDVWSYFTICIDNANYAKCRMCGNKYSRGGNSHTTSNLRKHLKTAHKTQLSGPPEQKKRCISNDVDLLTEESVEEDGLLPGNCEETGAISRPIGARLPKTNVLTEKQPTLQQFADLKSKFKPGDKRAKVMTDLIAEMICIDNQPFSIVEDRGFNKLIKYVEPRFTMPSRKHIANTVIPRLYEKTENAVKETLQGVEYAAATTDMWTSGSNDDYMSLTVHYIDQSYEFKHLCVEVVPFPEISHTSVNIAEFLEQTFTLWGLNEKIVAVIHDNAHNVTNAMNIGGYPHFPCLAHSLQLVLKEGILNNRNIQKMIGVCRRIVSSFKHSSKATKILKNAQLQLSVPRHRLIQDEVTRWNSTLHMLQRLKEQKRALIYASADLNLLSELTPTQWDLMDSAINILSVFDKATLALSTSNVTISEVIPIVNSTKKALDTMKTTLGIGVQGILNDLVFALDTRFGSIEENDMCAIATLLDPRMKSSMFTNKKTLERVKKKVIEIAGEEPTSTDQVSTSSTSNSSSSTHGMWSYYSQLADKAEKSVHIAATVEQELNTYLLETNLKPEGNITQYWKDKDFRALKQVAKKYLCIPPATVFSERLFSTAGLICDRKRNRLDPDRVRMLAFLNKNL